MPGQTQYGSGGRKNPDIQPNAHKPGYKWDARMGLWYKPLVATPKKKDNLKIA